jgi:hypothetical protein
MLIPPQSEPIFKVWLCRVIENCPNSRSTELKYFSNFLVEELSLKNGPVWGILYPSTAPWFANSNVLHGNSCLNFAYSMAEHGWVRGQLNVAVFPLKKRATNISAEYPRPQRAIYSWSGHLKILQLLPRNILSLTILVFLNHDGGV